MKAVIVHLVILGAILWGACSIEVSAPDRLDAHVPVTEPDRWRRTVDGWENRTQWSTNGDSNFSRPRLSLAAVHPLNIATLQALISTAALLLLAPTPPPAKQAGQTPV